MQWKAYWRREWDSNPRSPCDDTRFPGAPNRPLWHLSIKVRTGADGTQTWTAPYRSGEGGIRTHDEVAPILVFETSALSRSATSPTRNCIIGC
jgi:hypothetical protein